MREQDNLAYDFDLFTPKKENIIDLNRARANQPQQKRKPDAAPEKSVHLLKFLRNFALVAFVVGILCMGLYTRGRITEIKSEIEKTKSAIETLKSEETRLNMEIEASLSVKNIEREAESMGMQKQEREQTSYLVLDQADEAEVLTEEDVTLFGRLKALLTGN